MKKNILSRTLSLALSAVLLAGCAGNPGSVKSPGQEDGGSQGKTETTAGETKAPDGALGRYVENQIEFPFDAGEEIIMDIVKNPEGNLELFTEREDGAVRQYILKGGEWSAAAPGIIERRPGVYVQFMTYGPEGELYLLYKGDEYEDHIGRVVKGGEPEEILKDQTGKLDYALNICATDDGSLVVSQMTGDAVEYRADGTVGFKFPQADYFMDWKSCSILAGDTYITDGEKGFLRYSMKDGEQLEEIPFQNDQNDVYGSLAAGEGTDFYLCNARGIHHITENGILWETVVEGSLSSLGLPSVSAKRLFTGKENDFFVWYTDGGEFKLAHYVYDAKMPSVPSQTLTVYGLDLSENQTIRQAAALFQMERPEVKVEVIDGKSESGGAALSDTIRTLNTELLGGNGADVLVLDGLPVDSYIEKGVLEDLTGIVEESERQGGFYPNLAEPLKAEDGNIYQVPSRVLVPIAYGKKEAVDSLADLKSLNSYQTAHPDRALIGRANYENILRMLACLYYDSLWDPQTGGLDSGQVELLLDTAKKLGAGCGAEIKFKEFAEGEGYNTVLENGFYGFGYFLLHDGKADMTVELPTGMMETILQFTVMKEQECQLKQVNGAYFTSGVLGVNRAGSHRETAKEFVDFVLSGKVQGSDLSDGFPVSREGGRLWEENEANSNISVSSFSKEEGSIPLQGEYPGREDREKLLGLTETLKTPSIPDAVVMEMIVSESKGFFEGTVTAADAAVAAANRSGLYRAE